MGSEMEQPDYKIEDLHDLRFDPITLPAFCTTTEASVRSGMPGARDLETQSPERR